LQSVQHQAVFLDHVDKCGAADHYNRSAGARQHPAEVAANRARADYGNARPIFR